MYDLPTKRNRREATVDGPILRWLEQHHPRSFALEVKVKGGRMLPHQEKALATVSRGSFSYKIPDMGKRNPFDAFCLKDADAIVCVADGGAVECRVNDTYTMSFTIRKSTR